MGFNVLVIEHFAPLWLSFQFSKQKLNKKWGGALWVALFGKLTWLLSKIRASKVLAIGPISGPMSFISGDRASLRGLEGDGRELVWPFFFFFFSFLFPLFYLCCHYVSSAVFNGGSSLQAVSGCTAVGGVGDSVAIFFLFFFFGCHCLWEARVRRVEQADAANTSPPPFHPPFNNGKSSFITF